MNILFVGDIVGKVGRKALSDNLAQIKEKYDIEFVIANGENISRGKGITKNHYDFLIKSGVDCITLGNHYKDREDIKNYIDRVDKLIRPLNLKEDFPGVGTKIFYKNGVSIRVSNLLGLAYSKIPVNDPYLEILSVIENDDSDIHIIDFHADATGEKKAFAYALKNSVSAVIGTHTHVQTRDAQILNGSLLYITDVGMCGSYNSILGTEINSVINRIILHDETKHFEYLDEDDRLFSAVVLKFDDLTLKGTEIIPIYIINKRG